MVADLSPITLKVFAFVNSFPLVGVLFSVMMIDTVMGIIYAYVSKTLSLSSSWLGVSKKIVTMMLVALALVIEQFVPDMPVAKMASLFYIGHEALSILAKAALMGVPLPPGFVQALNKMTALKKEESAVPPIHADIVKIEVTNPAAESRDVKDKKGDPGPPGQPLSDE